MKVAIVGGGVSGVFAAITHKSQYPGSEVVLFEKSASLLNRLKNSDVCFITHATFSPARLAKNFPRGEEFLKRTFLQFSSKDTINWFENRGIDLKKDENGNIFPAEEKTQTVIDCMLNELYNSEINIELKKHLYSVTKSEKRLKINFKKGNSETFDRVIIACGAFDSRLKYAFIQNLGHKIIDPVPSIFSFVLEEQQFADSFSSTLSQVEIKLADHDIHTKGSLTIMNQVMSGVSVDRLSSLAAPILYDKNYKFSLEIKWLDHNKRIVQNHFHRERLSKNQKKLIEHCPLELPGKIWRHLIKKSLIPPDLYWDQLSSSDEKILRKLLSSDQYSIVDKQANADRSITAGGVDLAGIDPVSMESMYIPNLFFAGSVMNLDGFHGGFNMQAAFTTGYAAAL